MKTIHSTEPILDFCNGLKNGEYMVNRDYQRSDKVWPPNAKSFLIETIVLDYPVPKLSLHQNLDVKSRKTVKQIVDGQQRSMAIQEFYQNKLRLSRTLATERLRNKTFEELDEEDQATFLNYGLNFDIFVGATVDEVREVFRRMNSFTIPLNPEETRHATFQGPFKWFINSLSKQYDTAFSEVGVFTPKQLTRMADAKLLTEISHAIEHGITTTSASSLSAMYKAHDNDFPQEEVMRQAIESAFDLALFESDIAGTPLAKPLNFYALALAYVHVGGHLRIPGEFDTPDAPSFEPGDRLFNLSLLADALEADSPNDASREFAAFALAAKDRTNVAAQRKVRFEFFLEAISV
ncbi:DUF262 domain-containing protein [Microbacterium proteolyticum]|uniref:DUF262 domain-containing protein n=1 Tax=Microbacterium proteolyticum TaxID=1572644 RepID=UPI0035C18389